MEEKEVKVKKKRPRPEGAEGTVKKTAGASDEARPKKKRPRPEGEDGATKKVAEASSEARPKKKRPRPEGTEDSGEIQRKKKADTSGEVRPKKKRPRSEGAEGSEEIQRKKKTEVSGEARPKKKRPRPEESKKVSTETKYADLPEDPSERKSKKSKSKKKKKGIGHVISTLILILALGVFAFSAFQLYQIFHGYQEGQDEYEEIIELAIEGNDEDEDGFSVNFDELLNINPDTVGWIRFYPEPAQINYPVVQGTDNSLYLSKTFSANDNTVGAIFVNVYNNPDFNDQHTIVYGHRMNDNSMFHDLAKYREKDFWEANPYFYIYTPDGRKITYHIYAAGEILETSDSYLTEFVNDDEFQNFLYLTEQESGYATGVEVTTEDTVVTLSTCVKGKDEARFVVRGVKELEETVK